METPHEHQPPHGHVWPEAYSLGGGDRWFSRVPQHPRPPALTPASPPHLTSPGRTLGASFQSPETRNEGTQGRKLPSPSLGPC